MHDFILLPVTTSFDLSCNIHVGYNLIGPVYSFIKSALIYIASFIFFSTECVRIAYGAKIETNVLDHRYGPAVKVTYTLKLPYSLYCTSHL